MIAPSLGATNISKQNTANSKDGLKKRLETSETKFSNAEVTLWMTNGSTRRVRVRRLVQMIAEIVIGGALGADKGRDRFRS